MEVTEVLPVSDLVGVVLSYLSPLLPVVSWSDLDDLDGDMYEQLYCWMRDVNDETHLICPCEEVMEFVRYDIYQVLTPMLEVSLREFYNGNHSYDGAKHDERWRMWVHGYLPMPPVPTLEYCNVPAHAHVSVVSDDDESDESPEPEPAAPFDQQPSQPEVCIFVLKCFLSDFFSHLGCSC